MFVYDFPQLMYLHTFLALLLLHLTTNYHVSYFIGYTSSLVLFYRPLKLELHSLKSFA
jgi:hypothetical protein